MKSVKTGCGMKEEITKWPLSSFLKITQIHYAVSKYIQRIPPNHQENLNKKCCTKGLILQVPMKKKIH